MLILFFVYNLNIYNRKLCLKVVSYEAHKNEDKWFTVIWFDNENFKLSGPYLKRVTVVNIITAPEIEMLVIHAEGKYDDYSRKRMKPSDYVKQHLKLGKIKS